jgi:hypothetical protein
MRAPTGGLYMCVPTNENDTVYTRAISFAPLRPLAAFQSIHSVKNPPEIPSASGKASCCDWGLRRMGKPPPAGEGGALCGEIACLCNHIPGLHAWDADISIPTGLKVVVTLDKDQRVQVDWRVPGKLFPLDDSAVSDWWAKQSPRVRKNASCDPGEVLLPYKLSLKDMVQKWMSEQPAPVRPLQRQSPRLRAKAATQGQTDTVSVLHLAQHLNAPATRRPANRPGAGVTNKGRAGAPPASLAAEVTQTNGCLGARRQHEGKAGGAEESHEAHEAPTKRARRTELCAAEEDEGCDAGDVPVPVAAPQTPSALDTSLKGNGDSQCWGAARPGAARTAQRKRRSASEKSTGGGAGSGDGGAPAPQGKRNTRGGHEASLAQSVTGSGELAAAHGASGSAAQAPPPPPSRTNWTRLVPPPVLTGHVSSLLPY